MLTMEWQDFVLRTERTAEKAYETRKASLKSSIGLHALHSIGKQADQHHDKSHDHLVILSHAIAYRPKR